MYRNNGSNVFDFTQAANVGNNVWHHIAALYDPSLGSANAKVYYDGVQQSVTANASSPFAITGQRLWLGSLDSSSRFWWGKMAQFQIFNKTLSSSEIAQIMTRPGSLTSNKAYWNEERRPARWKEYGLLIKAIRRLAINLSGALSLGLGR